MIDIPPIPDKEYFSIGEVSRLVQVPSYVLRYWESEFHLLRPARRTSGQRKYIKKDVEVIFQVKDLLYNRKFTIEGARKYLIGDRRKKNNGAVKLNVNMGDNTPGAGIMQEIKSELEDILKFLK